MRDTANTVEHIDENATETKKNLNAGCDFGDCFETRQAAFASRTGI